MKAKVVILTEAGKNIGFGHYTRCSAIKECMNKKGIDAEMLLFCNDITLTWPGVSSIKWLENSAGIIAENRNSVVLIDSYMAGPDIYSVFKAGVKKTIVIDDYNRLSYDADLVINPGVVFDAMDYSNQAAKCVGGKEYVILRKPFRVPGKKNVSNACTNILVTLGGTDYRNLLPLMLACATRLSNQSWTIIDPDGRIAEHVPHHCKMLGSVDASEMSKLMQASDLVISACGQTMHELVALNTPAIGICIDHDQISNQNFYLKSGFLQYKNSWNDDGLKENILQQIEELSYYGKRKEISEKCNDLLDRNGVENVVSEILS